MDVPLTAILNLHWLEQELGDEPSFKTSQKVCKDLFLSLIQCHKNLNMFKRHSANSTAPRLLFSEILGKKHTPNSEQSDRTAILLGRDAG